MHKIIYVVILILCIFYCYNELAVKPNPFSNVKNRIKAVSFTNMVNSRFGYGVYYNLDSLILNSSNKYDMLEIKERLNLASIIIDSNYAELKTIKSGNFFYESQYTMRIYPVGIRNGNSYNRRGSLRFSATDSICITELKFGMNDY